MEKAEGKLFKGFGPGAFKGGLSRIQNEHIFDI